MKWLETSLKLLPLPLAYFLLVLLKPSVLGQTASSDCKSYCEVHRESKHTWPDVHRVYCSNTTEKPTRKYPNCSIKCKNECKVMCKYSRFLQRHYLVCPSDTRTTKRPPTKKERDHTRYVAATNVWLGFFASVIIACVCFCTLYACWHKRRDRIRNSIQPMIQTHPYMVMSGYEGGGGITQLQRIEEEDYASAAEVEANTAPSAT